MSDAAQIERIGRLIGLERFQQAAQLCAQALLGAPGDPQLLVLSAWAELGLGELPRAIELARDAAVAAPHSDLPYAVLAEALGRADRHAEAAYAAYQAVSADPTDWRNHVRYAQRLAQLPDQQDQAWAAARRAVALAPGQAATHAQIAELALHEGARWASPEHLALAERALAQALRIEPDNATLLNDLARVQTARAGWVGGLAAFGASIRADPTRVGQVGRDNVDAVLRQGAQQLGWVLVGCAVLPALWPLPVVAALATAAALGYAGWLARRVHAQGPLARRGVGAVLRVRLWAQTAVTLSVLGMAGLAAGIAAPGLRSVSVAAPWLAGLAVVGIAQLAPRGRHTRRGRQTRSR